MLVYQNTPCIIINKIFFNNIKCTEVLFKSNKIILIKTYNNIKWNKTGFTTWDNAIKFVKQCNKGYLRA